MLIRITHGLRTIDEQNALYAQGRTQQQLNALGLSHVKEKPSEPRVTNAVGGTSFHNFGFAIDFVLIESGYDMRADSDRDGMADWYEVVEVAKDLGFEWGGDWTSFVDNPHFQMTFGLSCAQYRAGKQPSAVKVMEVIAKITDGIRNEENKEMTVEEKKAFAELQKVVTALVHSKDVLKKSLTEQREAISAQASKIEKLESKASMNCPSWAQEAVIAAVSHDLVHSPDEASYDFYRVLTIIHRAGLIK